MIEEQFIVRTSRATKVLQLKSGRKFNLGLLYIHYSCGLRVQRVASLHIARPWLFTFWNNHCTFDTHALLTVIKNKFKERFVTFWKKRMLNDESMKKLRTYKVLKQNFGIEANLDDIYDKSVRKGLSSFRISAHRLRIERGRYFGEKTRRKIMYYMQCCWRWSSLSVSMS